jgi:hypothetical protein
VSYEEEVQRLRERQRASAASAQLEGLDLFVVPLREMARASDMQTSKDAALYISEKLNRLHRAVLSAFTTFGPMTAKTAENLEMFSPSGMSLGYSTVRKRIGELKNRGLLRDTGEVQYGCTVWSADTMGAL